MISAFSMHWRFLWLVTASLLAGVMNAMAGGGSFLSFPAMLALGVPPVEANATNTVALWPGQLTSLATLRADMRRDLLPLICVASMLGGVAGAVTLLKTKQVTFLHLIPWLLLGGSVIFGVSGPVSRWLRGRAAAHVEAAEAPLPLFWIFLAVLPVCFYIGYFGAGGGFLLMTVLALFGVEEMHVLNSLKVLAACLSNFCAMVTFVVSGRIIWHYCLISMVFAGVGGYLGARYARRTNPEVLRAIVVVTGVRDRGILLLEAGLSGRWIEWIGFAAAFCTTAAFVPQLLRILRLRTAKEISLGTFLLFTFGVGLWLAYGLLVHSMPVIVSNVVTFALSLSILVLKLRFDGRARRAEVKDEP